MKLSPYFGVLPHQHLYDVEEGGTVRSELIVFEIIFVGSDSQFIYHSIEKSQGYKMMYNSFDLELGRDT